MLGDVATAFASS